jgi:ribosomal protein L7/L12
MKLTKEQLIEAVNEVENSGDAKNIVALLFEKFGTVIDPGFYKGPVAYAASFPEELYSVVITKINDRLALMHAIRLLNGMSLKEVKEIIDKPLPLVLKKDMHDFEAKEWCDKITDAGGTTIEMQLQ